MSTIYPVAFCGSGETAGSVSKINSKTTYGGGETTGSVSEKNTPEKPCPTSGGVSFKSQPDYDYYEKKKSTPVLAIVGTTLAIGAFAIGGLAYAHKTNAISKLKDGKIKTWLSKFDPATEKCHKWCSNIKTKSGEYWNKVKDFFKKKKS